MTEVNRGDLLTLVGRTQDTTAATKMLGVADRPTDVTDMAFVGLFIVIGALIGSLVFKVAGVPLTLSTAGGALIAGIIGGWLRSVRPSFGRIPTPTVWFMNSVGLNIFIAIVGISAGPGFVNGLKTQGVGLFLWGAVATSVPLILGMFVAKYVFRFHDALNLVPDSAVKWRPAPGKWSAHEVVCHCADAEMNAAARIRSPTEVARNSTASAGRTTRSSSLPRVPSSASATSCRSWMRW